MRSFLIKRWESIVTTEDPTDLEILARFFLGLASRAYGLAMRVRDWGYKENISHVRRIPVPAISIGNISLGGTGKTQVVIWCAKKLREEGKKVVVLSRGYGRVGKEETRIVSDESRILASADEAGDEPVLIARSIQGLPVVVGADRAQSARVALERFSPDVFLLDDAFQHRKFHRDLDVVCVDEHMLEAPRLFPAGYLREGAGSLSRAQFLLYKTDQEDQFRAQFKKTFSFFPVQPSAVFTYEPQGLKEHATGNLHPLDTIKRRPVLAFSGIANPRTFERLLKSCGADLIAFKVFPDHHHFTDPELEILIREAREKNSFLVTTEKDRVRLPAQVPAWSLQVEIKWLKGESEFLQTVLRTVG